MTGSRECFLFLDRTKDRLFFTRTITFFNYWQLFDRLVPGTTLYFGTYEYTKRTLTAAGCPDTLAHLAGGTTAGSSKLAGFWMNASDGPNGF